MNWLLTTALLTPPDLGALPARFRPAAIQDLRPTAMAMVADLPRLERAERELGLRVVAEAAIALGAAAAPGARVGMMGTALSCAAALRPLDSAAWCDRTRLVERAPTEHAALR